ncbi:DNA transfer protein p32 [Acinetobacter sp. YH12200]|uniref:DNA transfer protein p32 n=1 Tax=Acinetobacter sp. YH12200 TaxID=2601139 RepID=UPI00211DE488|nr:DNA transfer protein p32 [Acinetobacter sp. YH12200]
MGMVAGALGVGSALLGYNSSKKQAKAATQAADTQAEATRYASDMQKDMFNEVRADQKPYMQAGTTALDQLMGQMGPNGFFNQTYSGQDIYSDPSYQFRLNEGLNAVQSGAAAQGGLLSGATQKALMNYGQQSASQEYQNAYNRHSTDQTNQYNRLSNLVGVGQNAAAGVGNAGMQTSQAMANNTMAGASARADGITGAASARAKGMEGLIGGAGSLAGMFI